MDSIAHIRLKDGKHQTVEEHLLAVKSLAEAYGKKMGIEHLAGLAGMLHDLGKYSDEFREYILYAVANPTDFSKRGSVDHSTAGGKWLYERLHMSPPYDQNELIVAEVIGNAIISHHSYLHDFMNPDLESDYLRRVRDKELMDFEVIRERFYTHVMSEKDFKEYVDHAVLELKEYLEKKSTGQMSIETKLMFLTKVIFSMLIDADRTDSRQFEEEKKDALIDIETLFTKFYSRLNDHLGTYSNDGHINQLRAEMSRSCEEFAENPSGIFTLSIPTGGGKTFASLRYALKHALSHQKQRIIYVVPYTTIIEQNAKEVREALSAEEHLLEHHSNIVEDYIRNPGDELDRELTRKLKLARDNWDSPIIFTTMVQYLNVFYDKSTRNTRRLHNLLASTIIFDEVQKVPMHCTSLFNLSVNFLSSYGNSSVLLCTATQPSLDTVRKHQLEVKGEIINNLDEIIEQFKRVELIDKISEITNNDQLCEFIQIILQEKKSLLVIQNTKGVVKELYEKLQQIDLGVPVYHLSTSMCGAHRQDILGEIKEYLKREEPVICLSTQLIEAGVDISFECVIRSLAGLDSIAQAAGRCNRHGNEPIQQVYVVDNKAEKLDRLEEINKGKVISKKLFDAFRKDPTKFDGYMLSRKAMERYFTEYYQDFKHKVDYPIKGKSLVSLLTANIKDENNFGNAFSRKNGTRERLILQNSYKTAAEAFQVINENTTSVIVPYKEGKELIADLTGSQSIEDFSQWLKKAQLYTISIYSHTKHILQDNGGIIKYIDKNIYFLTESAYHEEVGLDLEVESYEFLGF